MELLSKDMELKLYHIIGALTKGIERTSFLGAPMTEKIMNVDAKWIKELEAVLEELREKNDDFIILNKEAMQDFYFIPKKKVIEKIKVENKDENTAVAYLSVICKEEKVVYFNRQLMTDEELQECGVKYLLSLMGFKDIKYLENISSPQDDEEE